MLIGDRYFWCGVFLCTIALRGPGSGGILEILCGSAPQEHKSGGITHPVGIEEGGGTGRSVYPEGTRTAFTEHSIQSRRVAPAGGEGTLTFIGAVGVGAGAPGDDVLSSNKTSEQHTGAFSGIKKKDRPSPNCEPVVAGKKNHFLVSEYVSQCTVNVLPGRCGAVENSRAKT